MEAQVFRFRYKTFSPFVLPLDALLSALKSAMNLACESRHQNYCLEGLKATRKRWRRRRNKYICNATAVELACYSKFHLSCKVCKPHNNVYTASYTFVFNHVQLKEWQNYDNFNLLCDFGVSCVKHLCDTRTISMCKRFRLTSNHECIYARKRALAFPIQFNWSGITGKARKENYRTRIQSFEMSLLPIIMACGVCALFIMAHIAFERRHNEDDCDGGEWAQWKLNRMKCNVNGIRNWMEWMKRSKTACIYTRKKREWKCDWRAVKWEKSA